MCHLLVVVFFLFVGILEAHGQEGAQYLQTAIKAINNLQNNRRIDMDRKKVGKVEVRSSDVPPLSLTKGELAELYEKAVNKGKLVKIEHGDGPHIHAAVHELDEPPSEWGDDSEQSESNNKGETEDGYYYYYYPLKSFIDEMTSQPHMDVGIQNKSSLRRFKNISYFQHPHHHYFQSKTTTTPAPIIPQYHSHTHQVSFTDCKPQKHKQNSE